MHSHTVSVASRIVVSSVIGDFLCSQNIGISRKLAAKFEQTGGWTYFKDYLQQVVPLECLGGSLKIEAT